MLKIIACIAMLCDHIGKSYIKSIYGTTSISYVILSDIIGRIAFPIFCALFIQAIMHTKKEVKHLITLSIFAVLSEPCFDKAIYHTWFFKDHQNVMLSWLLSCLTIVLLKKAYDFYEAEKLDIFIYSSISISIILLIFAISVEIKTDYSKFIIPMSGTIFMLWKTCPKLQFWVIGGIICIAETILYKTPGTLIAIPIMLLYDSETIQINTNIQKYSFYIFYPLHLLILGLIC